MGIDVKLFAKWRRYLLISAIISILIFIVLSPATQNLIKKKSYRSYIPASKQRPGNPEKGFKYLVEGNYIVSGVPLNIYKLSGLKGENILKRSGDNASLPYYLSAVTAPNGERVVTPNCLHCHAQRLDGEVIIGLGNSTIDFTQDFSSSTRMVGKMISLFYGADSPKSMAYKTLSDRFVTISPQIRTEVRGVNPADNLAYILAQYRDPVSLVWNDKPLDEIKNIPVVPTDVPAWWTMKKKHAMFYTASGRGDFSRLMMASSLLTMKNTKDASHIDKKFPDILAYINQIKAPKWPKKVNSDMVIQGRKLFKSDCTRCHGSYGPGGKYPNYLISLDSIKTDPLLAEQLAGDAKEAIETYNKSWFAKGPFGATLSVESGYVAPPLDGVWATAPYLHNGSVPDLASLLNSTLRPKYWQRSFYSYDYDFNKIGWTYKKHKHNNENNKLIYDTTKPGYGNQGHYYADDFTDDERQALIEYLKTL